MKSKLSSTFYQLLQASLIYLSKLFAILSLLNILKEIEFQSSKFQKGKNLSYYWIYMLWKTLESYFRHLINVYKQEFIFLVYTLPSSSFASVTFFQVSQFFWQDSFFADFTPLLTSQNSSFCANFHFLGGHLSTICHLAKRRKNKIGSKIIFEFFLISYRWFKNLLIWNQ